MPTHDLVTHATIHPSTHPTHVTVALLPNLDLSPSSFLPFSSALLCFLALHFFFSPNPSP